MQHYHTQGGQAVITAVIFFLIGSLIVVAGVSAPVVRDVQAARDFVYSKQSFYLAEGAIEDVTYRVLNGIPVSTTEVLTEGLVSATVTIVDTIDQKEILAVGDANNRIRKVKVIITEGSGVAFNYGVQADVGGIILENFASIKGNVYSNGPLIGENNNSITGDAVSADTNGRIDGINVQGSAYAHTIINADVDLDAYYQVIGNTTVGGAFFPNSPDQATTTLPISDEQIVLWEQDAEAGGVIAAPCPYQINDDTTLGPVKINCDLEVSGTPTITLGGAVWVVGNISIENTAIFQIDPVLGNVSVPVIADNPADRLTSSRIEIENKTQFFGTGGNRSYILFISQNESAESGGNESAIDVKNNVIGDLLVYAAHGEILLQNSIGLKEVSGYRIRLKNNAEVIYESGLANLLFTTGPAGGFTLDSWEEVE